MFTERSSGRRFAYYTDCKTVPPAGQDLARGVDLLLIDGLRPNPHPTHQSIPEAIEMVRRIAPARAYLTHIAHSVGHAEEAALLPDDMGFAQDEMRVVL